MPDSGEDSVSRETPVLRWVTDRGLLVASGANTLALYRRLASAGLPEVMDLVPADGTLLIVLKPGAPVPAGLPGMLKAPIATAEVDGGRLHRIATRFDGEDLAEVAEQVRWSTDELVEQFCALTLNVKYLGFQPGFAYLEGLPPVLRLPRRARPRTRVPAGSVALGGGYCGIYPAAGPGGWHLLGTTEQPLFNPAVQPPALLQPGDRVRLVPA